MNCCGPDQTPSEIDPFNEGIVHPFFKFLFLSESMNYIFFIHANPIKAGPFSGGWGGPCSAPPPLISVLWEIKTSKTHISQICNVPSFNFSP